MKMPDCITLFRKDDGWEARVRLYDNDSFILLKSHSIDPNNAVIALARQLEGIKCEDCFDKRYYFDSIKLKTVTCECQCKEPKP